MVIDDDILSAERIYSTAENLDDYQRLCEAAAETHTDILDAPDLLDFAGDVCRALDRAYNSRPQ